MTAIRTARDRARAELTREIKDEARRQLAASGAPGLSLRAVARELGMVSSALYRYFPRRDDLLTALIIDAYNAVGERGERAVAKLPADDFLGRWLAAAHAVRAWALKHPHEYALVYGSPVPGYQAPTATNEPASRIPFILLGLVRDAWDAGEIDPAPASRSISAATAGEIERLTALTELPQIPHLILARTVIAWTQLYGMVSFELFGQFNGVFEDRAAVFDDSIRQLAWFVGFQAR